MDILLKCKENNYTYLAVNKITLAQTFSAGGGGMSGRRNVCQVRVGRFEIIAAWFNEGTCQKNWPNIKR